jgi:sodium-independent sulfate anion transporter 11
VYSFWRISPLEFFIWLAAVLVTIFSSIENGIYTSIASSGALLLIRIAHPRGHFLGRVTIHEDSPGNKSRDVFVSLKENGITTSHLKITPPSPGVIVYRSEESYIYPNSSLVNTVLVDYVKEHMRRGKDMSNVKASDRPWNDPGPRRHGAEAERAENETRPVLHAIVLDFAAV